MCVCVFLFERKTQKNSRRKKIFRFSYEICCISCPEVHLTAIISLKFDTSFEDLSTIYRHPVHNKIIACGIQKEMKHFPIVFQVGSCLGCPTYTFMYVLIVCCNFIPIKRFSFIWLLFVIRWFFFSFYWTSSRTD